MSTTLQESSRISNGGNPAVPHPSLPTERSEAIGYSPTAAVGVEPACLSKRETQVLSYIAQGDVTDKIAGYLGLSPKTVEKYRANILTKFKTSSMIVAVRRAIRQGLLAP
jgi:DNA-binding NarL/FixJ family response regulator